VSDSRCNVPAMAKRTPKKTKDKATHTKDKANVLLTRIRSLSGKGAQNSADLAQALHESYHGWAYVGGKQHYLYELWGYRSWEEFVGKEAGLHLTTAYSYVRIWQVFYIDLAGAWDVNDLLPFTKMRALTSAPLTKTNVSGWLKRAKNMTCSQLVAKVYGKPEVCQMRVAVTASQQAKINDALTIAREAFPDGLPRGDLLAKIAGEWLDLQRKTRGLRLVADNKREAS
jgi:hypothetical protein